MKHRVKLNKSMLLPAVKDWVTGANTYKLELAVAFPIVVQISYKS
jgi:hypothetical protein